MYYHINYRKHFKNIKLPKEESCHVEKPENKMRIFLWNHSPRNKAMIPKGSIDTSELTNQTEHFLEKLKEYLDADPQAFRQGSGA